MSVDGFQSGSYKRTRFAPVRLTPRPPTCMEVSQKQLSETERKMAGRA